MKILVGCEESQAVCKAFRNKGHEAYSCDIKPTSGKNPQWHIQDDILKILNQEKWDMLIAFPPCTYLTNAGHCRINEPGRIEKMKQAKEFFLKLYNANIERIAIENPVPMKMCNLPKYSQIIQPYEFGENYKKRTCLWLKNLPPLIETCKGNSKDFESWTMNTRSAAIRAKTFKNIAKAMAEQWNY